MVKIFCVTLLCCWASVGSYAQAGIEFHGGITSADNNNTLITPEGDNHQGWHIGADARLNQGKMYFVVGLQYHTIDFLPSSSEVVLVEEDTQYNWTKLRVGLGYQVIRFSDKVFLRGHTLASFNLVNGVPTDAGPNIITNYNSSTAGANLGLGLDIFNFTLTASYEIGFFNLANMLEESEMNFLTFSLGYKI